MKKRPATILVPAAEDYYPAAWAVYNAARRAGHTADEFGIDGRELRRFVARYRLAKTFIGVHFDGVSKKTTATYGAILRLVLTYTAYEQLWQSDKPRPSETIYRKPCSSDLAADALAQIGKIKNQIDAFGYFLDLLDRKGSVWNAVKKHIHGEIVSPVFLSAAIRHGFAHGGLTAYPTLVKYDKDVREEIAITAISSIAKILTKFLMHEIDRQFTEKVKRVHHVPKIESAH